MDTSSCERLWRSHANRLLLYATALVRDRSTAEDVLQAVFTRIYLKGLPHNLGSESGYLFQAVRNESLNALRSSKSRSTLFSPLFEPPDPGYEAERLEFGQRVESVLGELPEGEREAIVLKIWGELSFTEAAEVADLPAKTLEHRYYRGIATLKEKLRDE